MQLAVVVPFLNEAERLPVVLEAIAAQERPPDQLLLVDDGSTDGSAQITADFAGRHDYALALQRPTRAAEADRLAAAQEYRAFLWAVEQLAEPWDVVGKLDGD